ncbi:MAG TPA: hypothetical protein VJU87_04540 [Gemmatimonadaceae bacterium]|nr:hypothetical protein [Gemmatimonadaceae bacterium]
MIHADSPPPSAEWASAIEDALRLPMPPVDVWHRAGISPRAERRLEIALGLVLYLLVVGWVFVLSHLRTTLRLGDGTETPSSSVMRAAASVASALSSTSAPSTAYLTDALLEAMLAGERGESGELRAAIDTGVAGITPDTLPPGAQLRYSAGGDVGSATPQPTGAGVWNLVVAIGNAVRPLADFSLIAELPFSAKRGGRIGLYFLGDWPAEHAPGRVGPAKAPTGRYANPSGFIQVTPQNEDTYVSTHFRLRDFVTHDQPNVWPKYIVLQISLIDKLELVLSDLEEHGIGPAGVRVLSGFRTPQYNATGGVTAGRADLSRHMYGDAADIFIDDDGNGVMDDLNRDGRVDVKDSRVIEAAVDRVEAAHPELVGGAGIYPAARGHGPFIHIDTRGYRARWVGGPGGG